MKRVTFAPSYLRPERRSGMSSSAHQVIAVGLLAVSVVGFCMTYQPKTVGAQAKAQHSQVKAVLMSAFGIGMFVGVVYLGGTIATGRQRREREAAEAVQTTIDAARERYERALKDLDEDPDDITTRKRALEAGRAYADVVRTHAGHGGVTMFDEIALSNDLNARTGRRVT